MKNDQTSTILVVHVDSRKVSFCEMSAQFNFIFIMIGHMKAFMRNITQIQLPAVLSQSSSHKNSCLWRKSKRLHEETTEYLKYR